MRVIRKQMLSSQALVEEIPYKTPEKALAVAAILQTLKDVNALTSRRWRFFLKSGKKQAPGQSESILYAEERSLRHWINSDRFHWYCEAIGIDGDRAAQKFFRWLQGHATKELKDAMRRLGNANGGARRCQRREGNLPSPRLELTLSR